MGGEENSNINKKVVTVRLIKEPTDRKNLIHENISLLKEILIIIAMMLGGIWAIIKFDQIDSNSARIKYELDLKQSRADIQISTRLEYTRDTSGAMVYVYGTFYLKNIGSKDVMIQCNLEPPVTAMKMTPSSGSANIDKQIKFSAFFFNESGEQQDDVSIDVGNEVGLPFFIAVPTKGYYLLNASVPVDGSYLSPTEKAKGEKWEWSEQRILNIK